MAPTILFPRFGDRQASTAVVWLSSIALGCVPSGPAQDSTSKLIWQLGQDGRHEQAAAKLVALGPPAVPHLLRALRTGDSNLRQVEAVNPDGDEKQLVPILKIRSLEVLRRMEANASSALPALFDLIEEAPSLLLGNVLDATSYIVPATTLDEASRERIQNLWRGLVAEEGPLWLADGSNPGLGYVTERAGKAFLTRSPRQVILRFKERCVLPRPFHLSSHNDENWEKRLFAAELACDIARNLGPEKVERGELYALRDRLARYYPADKNNEATALRDLVNKINERYLDALAKAAIVLAPGDCALGYVHVMQGGSLSKRTAAVQSIGKLGSKAGPAVPWLVSVAKYEKKELAREAITVSRTGKGFRSRSGRLRAGSSVQASMSLPSMKWLIFCIIL